MKLRIFLNCLVVLVLIVLTASFGGKPLLNVVNTLEQETFDWRLARHSDSGTKQDDIVIVDIDRDSLRKLGNWPWNRDTMAEMLDQLFDNYKVGAVAFTFPFPLPNNEGVQIFDTLRKEIESANTNTNNTAFSGGDTGTNNLGRGDTSALDNLRKKFNYDDLFIKAMKNRRVFLGYSFDTSARVEGSLPKETNFYSMSDSGESTETSTSVSRTVSRDWNFYSGYRGNLSAILKSSIGAGHINFIIDADGFVRRVPMVVNHAKKIYESMALGLLRRADNTGQTFQVIADGIDSGEISALSVGRYLVPISDTGEIYINFLGAGGREADFENSETAVFRYISAKDVISGRAAKGDLRDKIVLVGSSNEVLRQLYPTPVNSQMPGAELLATQLANIIDGEVLHRLFATDLFVLIALIGVALLMAVVFSLLGPALTFGITVVMCGIFVYLSIYFWDTHFQVVNMVQPLFVFISLFLFNSISGFVFEWRASRNLQSSFGQYVPPELAKRIGDKQAISLEGESREISVLFSDVRNFTAISEKFTPHELTLLMNRMLTGLSEAIHHNSGTVDKFIGDAVMAFWNAPLDDPNHPKNSVKSALEMQEAMVRLSAELKKEGRDPMKLGIGICTGTASVGNMGSKLRVAYTAMGDTVNVAARVEGLTKYYKVGILVTESTYKQCESSGIRFRVVDQVRVKGREEPLVIYEPLGEERLLPPEKFVSLDVFEKMRLLYVDGDFAAAKEALTEYQDMEVADLLASVYEERLDNFLQNPPESWDGVTNFEVK